MSHQHRSPASMQDIVKEPDVPTEKRGMDPRTKLLLVAVAALIVSSVAAFFLFGVSSTPAQSTIAPAQVAVPAENAEATRPGIIPEKGTPGIVLGKEGGRANQAISPPANTR